ncbi:MAG TPA: type II toxin-antitoxin system RelE/ParE family toxin [Longimicrobium sp.]|nr:type II toxin-antitoxin system RelE/ParE family toxin [Longimicrobium sp.]
MSMNDSLEVVASSWFTAEVRALPRLHRDRIDSKVATFTRKGWSAAMGDQTIKPLRDGIYELRVLGRGAAFRLLFFVMPGLSPRLVVLTTCALTSDMLKQQRMEAEIDRAIKRRGEWMEQRRKEEVNDEG